MGRNESAPIGAFSASALKDAELCLRRWAWRKLDGIEGVQSPSAEFGTRVHAQIEQWLVQGIPFDLTTEAGECALAGLHLLPKPGTPGMSVEKSFTLPGWGHTFFGYKDLELPGEVWDYKTSSDPKRWGLTTETLPDDIQAALYAADTMVKTGSNSVVLVWHYLKSKRPYKATPVRVQVSRQRIEPTLLRIKGLADDMAVYRDSGAKALDLPYSANACEMYGGCPYQSQCNLTTQERMVSIMTGQVSEADKEALKARLRQKSAAESGGAGPAVNPPSGVPGRLVLPEGAKVTDDGKLYWTPGMADWAPVPSAPPAPPPLPNAGPPLLPASGPPPLPNAPPSWTLPEGGQYNGDKTLYWAPGMTDWAKVPDAPPSLPASGPPPLPNASASLPSTAEIPAGKGRGRPRGSKNKTSDVDPKRALVKALLAMAEAIESGALESDEDD